MEKFLFTVDSALLSELGERLVESAHIALLELVKNAYDADATAVTVKITPRQSGGPDIEVADNGVGMTFEQVQSYWMRIATTHKAGEDASPIYGRPLTGSKGIGRFSCRRLGTRLTLATAARKGNGIERTEVIFDWSKFKAGSELADIECRGSRSISKEGKTGTTLIIQGARRDEWDRRSYNYLKRQFAVLVANRGARRKGFEADPGFNIRLVGEAFDEKIENLRERLLEAGWGDLTVTVDERGKATCQLSAMRVKTRSITYPRECPNLAGAAARIGILVAEKGQLRDKTILSLGTLRGILREWGGVYVHYNGFRVYPFGEPGNDWLNIDRDRAGRRPAVSALLRPLADRIGGIDPSRALLQLLSNSSYVGEVEIDSRAKGFEMKASREGFLHEGNIGELCDLVRFAIDWATLYREYYVRLVDRESAEEARRKFEEDIRRPVEPERLVEQAVDVVQKVVRSLAAQLPTPQRQEIVRGVRTATEAILRREESNREELRHLRLVASTSTLLLIFSHEVKSLLSALEQINITLQRVQKHLVEGEARRVRHVREDLGRTKERFLDLLQMTSLISVDSRRAEPEMLALRSRVEKAKACYRLIIDSYGIEMKTDSIPTNLVVGKMLEAELYAVLLNAFSNSIKSVIAAGGDHEIEVTAARQDGRTIVHVRDTGLGLDEEHFDDVFVPFVADPSGNLYRGLKKRLNPEDSYIVGTGSGLGLSIVREILAARKGNSRFVQPEGQWKADLELTFP
jgi:signal transduction histidine kinase